MIYVYHLLLTPIHIGEVYLLYVCVSVRDCYSQSTNYDYNLEKTSMYQCWYKVDVTILWGRLDVDTSWISMLIRSCFDIRADIWNPGYSNKVLKLTSFQGRIKLDEVYCVDIDTDALYRYRLSTSIRSLIVLTNRSWYELISTSI